MDDVVTTHPASGPMVGPAGSTPADFDAARNRLGWAAQEAGSRLEARLHQAMELHDLDRRELLAAQRDVLRLKRAGLVPSPNDYWGSTAVPRASILVDASLNAIADELTVLGDAIDRFLVATSRSTLEPWISGAHGQAAVQRAGISAVDRVLDAIPPPDPINELGEWWQRRLHRGALVRSLPRLLLSGVEAELVVGTAELALLDGPPWSHGDRLLSAFELAHSEIRSQTRLLADDLTNRIVERGAGRLIGQEPGGPVTIELRG